MRYNRFQTDPIAHGDPCSQLACRADLDPNFASREAFGAIDAKYTSLAHMREGHTVVISGPTHDDQQAFDWRLAPELAEVTSHVGHPSRYDFGWMVIGGRDLSASPWSSSPAAAARPEISLRVLSLAVMVAAIVGTVAALVLLRPLWVLLRPLWERLRSDTTSGGTGYKHLLGDASVSDMPPQHEGVCVAI